MRRRKSLSQTKRIQDRKRNASTAKQSGPKNRREQRSKEILSDRSFEAKTRAFRAISRMRHDGTLPQEAAREENTTLATIKKYLPAALRRSKKTGKWTVTKNDRYVRILLLPGPHGAVAVRARGYS